VDPYEALFFTVSQTTGGSLLYKIARDPVSNEPDRSDTDPTVWLDVSENPDRYEAPAIPVGPVVDNTFGFDFNIVAMVYDPENERLLGYADDFFFGGLTLVAIDPSTADASPPIEDAFFYPGTDEDLRGLTMDVNGNLYSVNANESPDELWTNDDFLDIRGVAEDPEDQSQVWFVDRDRTGRLVGGRLVTQFLNVIIRDQVNGVVTGVAPSLTMADGFGNALGTISALDTTPLAPSELPGAPNGIQFFVVATNAKTPRPSANIGGNLADTFDIRGTAIASDDNATPFFVHWNGSNYDLFRMDEDPTDHRTVVGTTRVLHSSGDAESALNFEGDPINFIREIEADVLDPNVLYVIGNTDEGLGSLGEMFLYRIEMSGADTANPTFEVTVVDELFTPGGIVNALAHDPVNPDHLYYTQMLVRPDGQVESTLMRYDFSTGESDFAAKDEHDPQNHSYIRARRGTEIDRRTFVVGMDFNQFGDLIAFDDLGTGR
jgi:hypothetical protein